MEMLKQRVAAPNTDAIEREWNSARMAFYQAEHNFDNATPEYMNAAIEDLRMAEARMDNALRKLRLMKTEKYHNWTNDDLIKAQKETVETGERAVIFMEIQRRKERERNG